MPKVAPATTPQPKGTPATSTTPAPKPPGTTPAPKATPTPKPGAATPKPKAGATKPAITESTKLPPEPPADADADTKEKYHFEVAKIKASEDPQIRSLKAKADDATSEEESRKALRAYNKALFDKIRKIDSSVSERADHMEAIIMKRLGGE
jgi:hypothetical protein